MNEAKETLEKWLVEAGLKTYKELANYLSVSQNTLDVWKQRGRIPEKHILKYTQMKIDDKTKISIPNRLDYNISEKEIEILEAFRKLDQKKQQLYYHKILADAAQAEIDADEINGILSEDAKSAV
ncbi:MAG: helix-turn-helix domain-containing protein [Sulfurimonas sp.]|jgi:hypothetical protein|uniref:helix-turn-helix domain-containing protein n=1 Tax=Sulfurimonas sp. TaxID=2022749 RepID=UPI0035698DC1